MAGGFVDYGEAELAQKVGLPKLLDNISKKKIDYVIIPHLCMLSADEKKAKELMERIEKTGSKVISITLCDEAGYEQYSDLLDEAVFNAYFVVSEKQ